MTRISERPDSVSDAPADNWVDRFAPPHWRGFLRLSRADRPIGTWLLLLPCGWGLGLAMMRDGAAWRDLWILLACALGALVMRGAGCTWNDITDREIDAQVARTRSRPLPSGQVRLRGAYLWLGAQALIGLAVLLTLGPAAIWLGVLSLVPVAIYPFAKRFTWWPQLFLGIAFNWGVLLAFAAHAGGIGPTAILAYLAGIAWTLHYDTIYAHQDAEDDALIGVKSTARLFGTNSQRWLIRFSVAAVAALALAVLISGASWPGMLIALLGVAGFGLHLRRQIAQVKTEDPRSCLTVFHSNREAGAIVALTLMLAGLLSG